MRHRASVQIYLPESWDMPFLLEAGNGNQLPIFLCPVVGTGPNSSSCKEAIQKDYGMIFDATGLLLLQVAIKSNSKQNQYSCVPSAEPDGTAL